MAVIRCSLAKDGKLIPSIVEFEPGDAIRFKSDQPVDVSGASSTQMQVQRSFLLSEISAHEENGRLQIDIPHFSERVHDPHFSERVHDIRSPGPQPPIVPPLTFQVELGGQKVSRRR